jgi:hypothetical protein
MEDTQNVTAECSKRTLVFTSVLQNTVPLEYNHKLQRKKTGRTELPLKV